MHFFLPNNLKYLVEDEYVYMSQLPIIIVGNGISGTTVARTIRKQRDVPLVMISNESPYFFSRTALMYVFMGHMRWEDLEPYERSFWGENQIELMQAKVSEIRPENRQVLLENGKQLAYEKLVLATGSKPKFYDWKGQQLAGVQGLYSKQDLDCLEGWAKDTQQAVIVGGGLIGVELAEMLCSRGINVHFLVRERSFWGTVLSEEEGRLLEQHIQAHGVTLHLETELSEIIGDTHGRAKAVVTSTGVTIPCEFVGLTTGVVPNIDYAKSSTLEIDRGILVDQYLATNHPDIYAIGDCAQLREPPPHRSAIEAMWYTGRMMGETLAQTLCGQPTPYRPGNWFNSAKFFDIEYQTYGTVHTKPSSTEEHFLWIHPKKNIGLRVAYHPKTAAFLGLNAFGMRIRHQLIDQYLNEKITIQELMQQLESINFNPEFSTSYSNQIFNAWQQHQK